MKKISLAVSAVILLALTAYAEDKKHEDKISTEALVATKCIICHEAYDPANYTKEEWDTYADQMGLISQLSAEEIQALKDMKK
ncbi:MAG: hypothetical protein ACK5LE_00615 [Alphaproteobacteria bacterium]